jgi:hypothetical protein
MDYAKLSKLLKKKTSSEKRMFFRLLTHHVNRKQRGLDIPPNINRLIERLD